CRVPTRTRGLACKLGRKNTRKSSQVRRTVRHSLRGGLRLMARSPRGAGLEAPVALPNVLARLDLSVGRPGPHAFAVRIHIARPATSTRPSHPAPNVRDDRDTPLCARAGQAQHTTDLRF